MAEWWEEDDTDSIWWKATKKNGRRICPDFMWELTIGGAGQTLYQNASIANKSVGFLTELKTIAKAGVRAEKKLSVFLTGASWCAGAYVGGGIDAWYQTTHNGEHLGTSIGDQVSEWWENTTDWYDSQEKGVENYFIKLHEWWRS